MSVRIRPGLTLLAVLGVASFSSLGLWQLDRAEEKRALLQAFAGQAGTLALAELGDTLGALRFRIAEGGGRYANEQQFLLDNIPRDGRPGYRVLTPFQLETGGPAILVDRGWLPATPDRSRLPVVSVDTQSRTIRGRLDELPQAGLRLGEDVGDGWPRVLAYADIELMAATSGLELRPWVLLLDADQPAGFRRDHSPVVFGPERHRGYAIQWFALALTVGLTWTILTFRRPRDG